MFLLLTAAVWDFIISTPTVRCVSPIGIVDYPTTFVLCRDENILPCWVYNESGCVVPHIIHAADTKRGKMWKHEPRLVLVALLIGWKIGARTLNQSLSEVIVNQSNSLITFDTQLKTARRRRRRRRRRRALFSISNRWLFICLKITKQNRKKKYKISMTVYSVK